MSKTNPTDSIIKTNQGINTTADTIEDINDLPPAPPTLIRQNAVESMAAAEAEASRINAPSNTPNATRAHSGRRR